MLSYTPRGIDAGQPSDTVGLESQALGLRQALCYGVMEVINGREFYNRIQEYSVNVAGKSHRVRFRRCPLPPGIEARAKFNPESDDYEIALTEQTCHFLQTGYPRGTWTIVHEAGGHLVLHAVLLQKLRQMPIQSIDALYCGAPHKPYVDTEWQADAFTGAFLMPAPAIQKLKMEHYPRLVQMGTIIQKEMGAIIQKYFHVSPEAAANRWDNFHYRSGRLVNVKPALISWSRSSVLPLRKGS